MSWGILGAVLHTRASRHALWSRCISWTDSQIVPFGFEELMVKPLTWENKRAYLPLPTTNLSADRAYTDESRLDRVGSLWRTTDGGESRSRVKFVT